MVRGALCKGWGASEENTWMEVVGLEERGGWEGVGETQFGGRGLLAPLSFRLQEPVFSRLRTYCPFVSMRPAGGFSEPAAGRAAECFE